MGQLIVVEEPPRSEKNPCGADERERRSAHGRELASRVREIQNSPARTARTSRAMSEDVASSRPPKLAAKARDASLRHGYRAATNMRIEARFPSHQEHIHDRTG